MRSFCLTSYRTRKALLAASVLAILGAGQVRAADPASEALMRKAQAGDPFTDPISGKPNY